MPNTKEVWFLAIAWTVMFAVMAVGAFFNHLDNNRMRVELVNLRLAQQATAIDVRAMRLAVDGVTAPAGEVGE